MPGIDWTYAGSIGGEGVEGFVATCLRQKFPDARQTKPASGDGGVDVVRDTADGLIVWQIKKFTTPLAPGQKRQIKTSWKRFWDTHVVRGARVKEYHLATPWTPTDPMLDWFKNEVCGEATFPVHWDGAAFFTGLTAEFPAVADRFFKGPDMLENMVNAKAILAASPIETADAQSMLEAISARDESLREIRDLVNDNYYLDTGTRTGQDGDWLPLPAPGEAGLTHRYRSLGNNRWSIETVVPRHAQSTEVEPLTVEVQLLVEPGGEDEATVFDWRAWGVPFTDIKAITHHRGGPLADDAPVEGLVSFIAMTKPDHEYPDLVLAAEALSVEGRGRVVLKVLEVTRGIVGGGLRVVGLSRSGIVQVEMRCGSEIAPDHSSFQLVPTQGLDPVEVRDELGILDAITSDDTLSISIADGPLMLAATGFTSPPAAQTFLDIATDLARLQLHTTEPFTMPDMQTVTDIQLEELHRLAEIYSGNAYETTWDRLVMAVGDDPSTLRTAPFDGTGCLVQTEEPTFRLGTTSYTITRTLATQYCTPKLATGVDWDSLESGDEFELVAGADNRLVVAAVVE